MRFHHQLFQPLHFDFGTTAWSVKHMPLFGSILSVLDHRRLGTIHNITFFGLMKILTNGRITKKQAQAIFNLLDLTLTGDLNYSELAFLASIVVAHKDHMEREFLYMNAWKIWVTFNEHGQDRITTREFRRTGLLFDFNYPTMYEMFRDYGWDDEKEMEFERFRFYLMSCIHFRQVNRFQAKYIRYRQFKQAVLRLLQKMLRKVLIENIYPSPVAVLRAIKTIKIPPLEGAERTKTWTDLFNCNFIRRFVKDRWEIAKNFWISKTNSSPKTRSFCKCIFCGFWCCHYTPDSTTGCCGDCDHFCAQNCCVCGCCKNRRSKKTMWRKPDDEMAGRRLTDAQEIGMTPDSKQPGSPEPIPEDNGREKVNLPKRSDTGERKPRAKVRNQLTRVEAVPEVEWRPLGKPRCGCGVQ